MCCANELADAAKEARLKDLERRVFQLTPVTFQTPPEGDEAPTAPLPSTRT